jgi:hypothetical protein
LAMSSDNAMSSKFRPGLWAGRLLWVPAKASPKTRLAGEVGAAPRGIYGALFVVVPPSMESIVCDVSL